MFYKQIIMCRGLSFDVKILTEKPLNRSVLSEEQFHEELEKGYADMKAGRTKDARQVFAAQIDKLKVAIQKSLDKTQLLFDSLMQEYFG